MSEERWKTVGRQRRGKQHGDGAAKVSSGQSLRRGNRTQGDESEGDERSGGGGANQPATPPASKKPRKSKPPPEKTKPDLTARDLTAVELRHCWSEAESRQPGSPQAWLKELTGLLQSHFTGATPDKEHTLAGLGTDYPLSLLPEDTRTELISLVASCPATALEGAFRLSLDAMMAEVRAGVSSCGSRLVLHAIVESEGGEVCGVVVERVFLLLQSCQNRVPEALSLLWAGLPPPTHPTPSCVRVWHRLCLPLLVSAENVPRQVFSNVVSYSCTLLRHLDSVHHRRELVFLLPPRSLCQLLGATHFLARRKQTDVDELAGRLVTCVLEASELTEVEDYFKTAFVQLPQASSHELLAMLALSCIECHAHCLLQWAEISVQRPSSSSLLLESLLSRWSQHQLHPEALAQTLSFLEGRADPRHKEICTELLGLISREEIEVKKRRSKGWCGGKLCCCFLMLATVMYLGLLAVLMHQVATKGLTAGLSPPPWLTTAFTDTQHKAVDVMKLFLAQVAQLCLWTFKQ